MSGGPAAPLRAAFGDALVEHEPVEIDGVAVAATLRPATDGELADQLAALAAAGRAALVRGGGSRLAFGNPPRRADVLLSTARLDGVEELDAEDGVVRVRAGTPLESLRRVLAAEGEARWELPLDPPGEGSTVGGALASAACGPRRPGFGAPRDCVLGLDVVLASGERTRCGGRVVKNVTGYDLAKLYVGSWGSLGVIAAAWLRLRPAPERVETRVAPLPDAPDTWARALDAARRGTARVASLVRASGAPDAEGASAGAGGTAGGGGWRLVLELAGEARAVERDAAVLEEQLGAAPGEAGLVADLRGRMGASPGPTRARLRLAVLPSALPDTRARLEAVPGCAVALVQPGQGLLWASCDAARIREAWAAARAAAAAGRGSFAVEALPASAKAGLDVHGDPGDALALLRALKQRFDPDGALNPGRFAGGL